jgi:hypothetical protein
MEGTILKIGNQFGVIQGNNGKRYVFSSKKYKHLVFKDNYVKFDITESNKCENIERVRYIGM